MTEEIKRRRSLESIPLIWNDWKTFGTVLQATPTKTGAQLDVQSPTQLREFEIEEDVIFRESGEQANRVNEFFILREPILMSDHARLSHQTSTSSCGGIYISEDGELFYVHAGRLPSDQPYPEHIAFCPWILNTCTIYDDRLIRESRPIPLKTLLSNKDFKSFIGWTLTFSANSHFANDSTIKAIRKTTGGRYELDFEIAAEQSTLFISKDGKFHLEGTEYNIKSILVTPPKLAEIQQGAQALYTVSLSDLKDDDAAVPNMDLKIKNEFYKRLYKKQEKRTFTHQGIEFFHITVGSNFGGGNKGSSYHFVKDGDNISFHMIGFHQTGVSDVYEIHQMSEFFKTVAESKKKVNLFRFKKTAHIQS